MREVGECFGEFVGVVSQDLGRSAPGAWLCKGIHNAEAWLREELHRGSGLRMGVPPERMSTFTLALSNSAAYRKN